MCMPTNKSAIIGAVVGGVIVYFLMKNKKKCPPCAKCGKPAPAPSFPTVIVQPTPAPAPPPIPVPPPPPPPPPPPAPIVDGGKFTASFVGFGGWVK